MLNSDSGYSLKTSKGTLIEIAANTFDVPSKTQVKVEVKEAYSMQDILLAGLSTESNGKPLRSAGMLYFNATASGKTVGFLKPIQATIPAKFYDSSMQVFKSEIKNDSSVNWITPQPVDTSPFLRNLAMGKSLFRSNCASCHKPLFDYTGPALAGARKRSPNAEWTYQFINNVNAMTEQDPYAKRLKAKYSSKMTQFNLPKRDIKAILDYCDNEAYLNPATDPAILNQSPDPHPCGYDTLYYTKPKENIEISPLKESTVETSSTAGNASIPVDNKASQTIYNNEEDEFSKKGYKYTSPEEGMYKFNIEESGWYNIDVFFNEPTAIKTQLFAEIQTKDKYDMNVYLCIPKRKILIGADRHNNNVYLFNYSDADGFLPMILNDDAFIFATASIRDKIYYGITKFTIRPIQTIKIDVKESSKEQVLNAIKSNQLDSIKLDIEKKEMEIIEKPCNGESNKADSLFAFESARK